MMMMHTDGQVELQSIYWSFSFHELHEVKQNVLVGQNVRQLQLWALTINIQVY